MEKLKAVKSIANLALNPLATTRNPFSSLGKIGEKFGSKKEGVPYQEIHLDHIIPENETQRMCKRLHQLSWWCFLGGAFLVGSALVLSIIYSFSDFTNQIDAVIAVMKIMVTLLFALVPFAFSFKYAFLADGVKHNMHFQHPNPLTYITKNGRAYLKWLFDSSFV